MLIGIIGNGFVGKATQLLKCKNIDIYVYDIKPELCIPNDLIFEDLIKCDFIFLCLPTPMNVDGSCYTNILSSTINKLKQLDYYNIVVRSTVYINYCKEHDVFFMPEFLTEKNWKEDFINNKKWIFGLTDNNERNIKFEVKINELINIAYNNNCIKSNEIIYMSSNEAELLKIIKNTFLATKIGYFNEIYDLAQKLKIDYNKVIDILQFDERIGNTHMKVPGYNNQRGYGGTCFPKDINNLYVQMNQNDLKTYYIQSSLERNEYHDRKERNWLVDIDRTLANCNKKIILVSGGAGFIGSNLCRKLVKDTNNMVICLDNLYSGLYENIQDLIDKPNFLFMKHDVKNKMFFPKLNLIYHLACPASPPFYQKEGIKTLKTSILGMMNILKLCKIHKCKMLFTSTSEIYGDPLEHPQKETYWGNVNPIGERSMYDEGKRVSETLVYEYRKKYNLDLKIVRIFNTYGPGMRLDDGRVITNYIKCIKDNKPITVYGDGNQTRSFCYIDDMINGLEKMMESNEKGPINLGNPYCEFTMNELVNVFEKVLGYDLNKEFKELPKDDPKQRKPDIKLAKDKLGWEPNIILEEGIRKMMKYYK
jgi:UDP-glucuronate decarboxylase